MTEQETTSPLEIGVDRYKAGEGPDTLIPYFQELCDLDPRDSAAFSCLAWLYLLDNQGQKAYKAAQKAVKLNPRDPQTRVNLVLAMLETGQKGVREQVETVQQLLSAYPEFKADVKENLEDGKNRKPDWQGVTRVQSWLFAD